MASTSPASVEWERANQVQISVYLVHAAKKELSFLAAVEGTPALKNRQVLEIAVARYLNCWLPLASNYTPSHALQPPLDCAWVWHCHKLNPVQYAKDCQQLFGKLVDVCVPGLNRTVSEVLATQIWTQAYPGVPYHFIRAGARVAEQQQLKSGSLPNKLTITFDLIAAIERQASFYYQVCRPWMYEDRYLEVALERYQGFLHLIKLARENEANGGPRPFLVPTYDIDLLWHTHQLFPTAYRTDTIFHIGTVLDHDDSDSNREAGGKLRTSFADTCERWLMRLLSGRWLEYEVAGSRDKDENKYVTLIRYTPDAPSGKATALINWQTASIEVKPDENVVLILLIAAAITASLLEMNYQPSIERAPKRCRKQSSAVGHLGAIQLQRNGLSDQWRRRSADQATYNWEANDNLLFYSVFWWELSSQEIYASNIYGAGCGGGACTAGSCGGGACSSAGGCGGGACGGGCGGGCGGCGG